MKTIKIIMIIIAIFMCCGGIGWYFGYHKPYKNKIDTCENLAIGGFINAVGDLDSIYEICKQDKLQKLYDEMKRKEGIDGASLEEHKKVYSLCDCAVRDLSKTIITGWVDKCVAGNEQWIDEAMNAKKRFITEPEAFRMLLELSYEMCESKN